MATPTGASPGTGASLLPQSAVDVEKVAQGSMASSEDATPPSAADAVVTKETVDRTYTRDYRFWAIIASLASVSMLASLESSVIVTSLPTIVEDLDFGSSYVWVGNVFFLAR